MDIPDSILRVALSEEIAFGPETVRPAEERLARRLPLVAPETVKAALEVARVAVGAAETLAREHVDGHRTQSSVASELAQRFPWLRTDPSDPPDVRGAWWRRFIGDPDAHLIWRLTSYGFSLIR